MDDETREPSSRDGFGVRTKVIVNVKVKVNVKLLASRWQAVGAKPEEVADGC